MLTTLFRIDDVLQLVVQRIVNAAGNTLWCGHGKDGNQGTTGRRRNGLLWLQNEGLHGPIDDWWSLGGEHGCGNCFIRWAADAGYEQTLKAQGLSQLAQIQEQRGTTAEIFTLARLS